MDDPCDRFERGIQALQLIPASSIADIPEWVFGRDYFLAISDGLDRWESLDRLLGIQNEGLLVVDNLEYASDWGVLPTSSGWPERAAAWRRHLRDQTRSWLLFEQPEGRLGRSAPDHIGVEREGRKITGVTWRDASIAGAMGLTVNGTCVVSPASVTDSDLPSLRQRCPYPSDVPTYKGIDLYRGFG